MKKLKIENVILWGFIFVFACFGIALLIMPIALRGGVNVRMLKYRVEVAQVNAEMTKRVESVEAKIAAPHPKQHHRHFGMFAEAVYYE